MFRKKEKEEEEEEKKTLLTLASSPIGLKVIYKIKINTAMLIKTKSNVPIPWCSGLVGEKKNPVPYLSSPNYELCAFCNPFSGRLSQLIFFSTQITSDTKFIVSFALWFLKTASPQVQLIFKN